MLIKRTIYRTKSCVVIDYTDIWQKIRQHFGFQSTGAHFLDLANVLLEPDERAGGGSGSAAHCFFRIIYSLWVVASPNMELLQMSIKKCRPRLRTLLFISGCNCLRMCRGGTSQLHRSTHFTNTTCSTTRRMTTTGTTTQLNPLITQNQTNQMTTNAINQNKHPLLQHMNQHFQDGGLPLLASSG